MDRVDRAERVDRMERSEFRLNRLFVDVLIEDRDELTEFIPLLVEDVDLPRFPRSLESLDVDTLEVFVDRREVRPMLRGVVERPRLTLRLA